MSFKPALIALLFLSGPVVAQHAGRGTDHVMPVLTEPGQGAFAAMSEVVALLRSDPATDWSTVDLGALQRHLVDMDLLITGTDPVVEDIPDGIRVTLDLSGRVGAAVRAMVPLHLPVLARETGWQVATRKDAQALTADITSPDDAAIIRALGFYGVMAVGDHHRAHHLALATGQSVH